MFTKLLRGFSPVLTVAALVAVVGISGTAWANHGKGNGSGNDNGNSGTATTTVTTPAAPTSYGDSGDWGDKSDHHGESHWKPKHHKKGHGNNDDDDTADYGVATVNVSRGHNADGVQNPASAWATYSTALGSPVGDTTGGTFRFTCSNENAPCTVSVAAAVLSGEAGSADVYPRVLIYRQNYDTGGPEVYCEYGDGSTGSAPMQINNQALTATPTYTAVPINIGGSADCSGPIATAGDVAMITVPAGYYDVHSTFVFVQ